LPVYEYFCKPCNAVDEVVRRVSQATDDYNCPECGTKARRHYSPPQVVTKGEQIPYMHPAFGTIMTDKQAQDEAKRRGWIEVGNEDVAKHTPEPVRRSYDEPDYFM
jgi:putative FmdB family regulatory protein